MVNGININLFDFQEKAVIKLLDIVTDSRSKQTVIMKSPTGSGKTIILIDFIEEFVNVNGMAPTIYEIAENFGIKTSTVFAHIRALQKKSILTRSSKARSIKLLSPDGKPEKLARRNSNAVAIPVIENFTSAMIADPAAYSSSKIFLPLSQMQK